MQTKKHSIIESLLNVFSGMVIAFTISQLAHWYESQIQQYIWSGFEWHISAGSNIVMTILFTLISIMRGYAWRRHFNKINHEEEEIIQGLLQQHKKGTKFRVGRGGSLFKFEEKSK